MDRNLMIKKQLTRLRVKRRNSLNRQKFRNNQGIDY